VFALEHGGGAMFMSESPVKVEYVDVLDVRQLAARLAARRWWIIISTGFFLTVFTAVAFLLPPKYRAATVVISAGLERNAINGSINSVVGSLGGLASLAGVSIGGGDTAAEESLAVLQSRGFTEAFISEKNLMPEFFAGKWDAGAGRWKVGEKKIPTLHTAFRFFDGGVRKVIEDKKTKLIKVQIDWKDRHEAADWSNELVRRLNSEMRRRAIAKADASLAFLEKELAVTTEIGERETLFRLIESQIRQKMLATVTQEYAFRVVDTATAPDEDESVRPKKRYMMAAGLLVGVMVGTLSVLMFGVDRGRHVNS
jgi:uncharacterized protein involved in exopolysaccharide biosynthesis